MKVKSIVILYLIVAIVVIGVTYISVELLFPRVATVEASLDGVTVPSRLNKFEKDNHYYITFKEQRNGNKVIKIDCTKEEYDFITNGKEIHIIYERNFFNRRKGKILKLDDKPIYNGNSPIAISSLRLVSHKPLN